MSDPLSPESQVENANSRNQGQPNQSPPKRLSKEDLNEMSRAARRVSTGRSESFMQAFKRANSDWKPDFSRLENNSATQASDNSEP